MDNDMLSDFFIEAEELFDEAEESLLSIEKTDDFESCFNSIFRAFHSVKGAAGMFGIDPLQQHMHYVENLLEQRKGNTSITSEMTDYLLAAVDAARKILKGGEVEFSYYDPDAPEDSNVPKQELDQEVKTAIQVEVNTRAKKKNSGGLIFVVDDEQEILDVSRIFLENENYKVETFTSAQTALERLNSVVPDLIISDIKMPEMNGVEFVREVNKVKPHLPVIVISGFVTKEICLDAMACGVAGVLEKPYDSDSLLGMIQIFVNRYKNIKLLNKSIDLLVYQFEDFDVYLKENCGESKRTAFREELKSILKQKKSLFENLN